MTGPADPADAGQNDDPHALVQPPQTPMYRAAHAARYQRQELLTQIEGFTGRPLLCYVATPTAVLCREDIRGFADLAHDLGPDDGVDVLIHTFGGDPAAAFRIAHLLRESVPEGGLRAIVPDTAQSAGTMLAASMDDIVMSDTSELGPVDPRVMVPTAGGTRTRMPALAYIGAFEDAVLRASKADATAPVWAELRDQFDPAAVHSCRQALAQTSSYLEQLLQRRHPSGGAPFTQVAANLLAPSRSATHGKVITSKEAAVIGLPVSYLPRRDDLWQAYWRLYCLQASSLQPGERLFESRRVSLNVQD